MAISGIYHKERGSYVHGESNKGVSKVQHQERKQNPMNQEQEEAAMFSKEGKRWGNAVCRDMLCRHEWIAVYFPKDVDSLECPNCHNFSGSAELK